MGSTKEMENENSGLSHDSVVRRIVFWHSGKVDYTAADSLSFTELL